MTYDCMSEEELALWRGTSFGRRTIPCIDCPAAFMVEALAAGRCCKAPTTPEVREARPHLTAEEKLRRKLARRRLKAGWSLGFCGLMAKCKHPDCTGQRALYARRWRSETSLTIAEIGRLLGGRSSWSVYNLLNRAC